MAVNQIAGGAVVLTTSADKMVDGLNRAQHDVQDWANQTQKNLNTKGLNLEPKVNTKKFGSFEDLAKGLKLSETAGLGLAGALGLVATKTMNMFTNMEFEKFTKSMERGKELAEQLATAIEKGNAQRIAGYEQMVARLDGKAPSRFYEEMATAVKTRNDLQAAMSKLREQDTRIMADPNRAVIKEFLPWTGWSKTMDVLDADRNAKMAEASAKLKQATAFVEKMEELKKRMEKLPIKNELVGMAQYSAGIVANMGKAQKSFEDYTKAQQKALALVGASDVEKALIEAQDKGFKSPNQLAEVRLLAEAKARKENTLAIEQGLNAKMRELDLTGLDAAATQRLDLVKQGADARQLARYDLMTEAQKKMTEAMEEANQTHTPKLAGAVDFGSTEAYKMSLKMQGFDVANDVQVHKDNKKLLEKIEIHQKELNDKLSREGIRIFGARLI